MAGAIPAGIYATNLPEACKYITDHSQAEVVVCDGNAQAKKYIRSQDGTGSALPHLKAIVVWCEEADPLDRTLADQCGVPVYTFDEFLQMGSLEFSDHAKALDERMNALKPGHCASIIYTSGTTGPPKGAMLSHDNITWTCATLLAAFMEGMTSPNDCVVSYLPLSHVVAQMIDVHAMIFTGGCTYFAQKDALKGSLPITLRDVRPTIFFGVPRVWEKIAEKMQAIGRQTTGLKKSLSAWAKGQGSARCDMAQFGQSGGAPCCYGCANSLVLSKIKLALGLDRCYFAVCGAAPMNMETLLYFGSLDIHIYEGFGQSECSGPYTLSCPSAWKLGRCCSMWKYLILVIDISCGWLT
jgi:long-chain-fatty-acid--CoA ligase ACSBG